jgi:hypothetical protein
VEPGIVTVEVEEAIDCDEIVVVDYTPNPAKPE